MLKDLHITPYLLSGDRQEAAAGIAEQAGIEGVMAEVLPADKAGQVAKLQAEGRCGGDGRRRHQRRARA